MASYHRVLGIFDRSIDLKSLECDYDIHPWDIFIDGERWSGKVRLIGFVDVFFLICYSGDSRFEHGVIIYKDDEIIRELLQKAHKDSKELNLQVVNQQEVDKKNEQPKYFNFHSEKGGNYYTVTSVGHIIDLKTRYSEDCVKKYEIKIRKGRDHDMKKRVRRGINQHGMFDLMHDLVRLGVITHAELVGAIVGRVVGGSTMEDAAGKYFNALTGSKGSKNIALSSDK